MENFATNTQIHVCKIKRHVAILVLCGLLCMQFPLLAQKKLSISDKKAIKLYEASAKKYKARDFDGALALLQKAVQRAPSFGEAYLRMASLHQKRGELNLTYLYYEHYVEHVSQPKAFVLEWLAIESLKKGDYFVAEKYATLYPRKKEENESIEAVLKSVRFAMKQLEENKEVSIDITPLPDEINHFKLQYLPVLTVDAQTMIYTVRKTLDDDEDIFVSHLVDNQWSTAMPLSNRINSPLNEGATTVSADGKTLVFTSCDRPDGRGSCDLYVTQLTSDNHWTKPRNMGSPINTKYWESQASLSSDGNMLFFSSNRKGGKGGVDIWYSIKDKDQWGTPQNMGDKINSSQDDTTPVIHFNGATLFFSSDGHVGMGGFDVFKSDMIDGEWMTPLNLGYPINTYLDEVALLIASDGKTAYFAKEKVEDHSIVDSRIYTFQLPDTVQTRSASYIVGKVVDKTTGEPLQAMIEVVDVEQNNTLFSYLSDSIKGEYIMVLPTGRSIAGYVKKKGYLFAEFQFLARQNTPIDSDTVIVTLEKIQKGSNMVLKNIYFDVDDFHLDHRSQSEINNVTEILHENEHLIVEISGHTDDTGSLDHNQLLSDRRAKSVYDELVKRGIAPTKMVWKGYADAHPKVPNTDEKNRTLNRRIEFLVLEK